MLKGLCMLDQSFSSDNFKKIFDAENNKGIYIEGEFFPDVAERSRRIKHINKAFRKLKTRRHEKKISYVEYIQKKDRLNLKKEEHIKIRREILEDCLDKVEEDTHLPSFNLKVCKLSPINGKDAYALQRSPESFFVSKQVQYNLRKLFNVKQQDKNLIIQQLKMVLNDPFPKYFIRADIKEFYESIDRSVLKEKLFALPMLTLDSKKVLIQILDGYKSLSGEVKGIPRGVGVSAYLAEIYLDQFDKKMNALPDLLYYARYVDDIVLVFCPKPSSDTELYKGGLRELDCLGLEVNTGNKYVEKTLDASSNLNFDYLGYTFEYNKGITKLSMKASKTQGYITKIRKAFDLYIKKEQKGNKRDRQILIKRIKFLTGNVKLLNRKNTTLVGIYFSNKFVDDTCFLHTLDNYLSQRIASLKDDDLKVRLRKLKFKDGFYEKKFWDFNSVELGQITAVWNHG